MERPDRNSWQAESLRLTAFPSPLLEVKKYNWWKDLVGEMPENSHYQPRMNTYQDEGQIDIGTLILKYAPERIDWILAPQVQEGIAEDIPILGTFVDVLPTFFRFMKSWLNFEIPEISRLAFGAVLPRPLPDRSTGYVQLSTYLPVEIDPQNSSDFTYQINRPRPSRTGIPDLLINRLSKWSVAAFQVFSMSIGTANVGVGQGARKYHCRLELDISTDVEFKQGFSKDQLLPVLEELIDLGLEIASKGDTA
jgi:hypothetical protein